MSPTTANGKICYLEIPAIDIKQSSEFYARVFGWNLRRRGDGALSFDDGVGQVSGSWVLGRRAADEPGLLFYIMVDDLAAATAAVASAGGGIVQPFDHAAREKIATFRDPAGNIVGLYQDS